MSAHREKLVIDLRLISQVERYKTGEHVHDLAGVLTIYFHAPLAYQKTFDGKWREAFADAELTLRKFVARRSQEELANV